MQGSFFYARRTLLRASSGTMVCWCNRMIRYGLFGGTLAIRPESEMSTPKEGPDSIVGVLLDGLDDLPMTNELMWEGFWRRPVGAAGGVVVGMAAVVDTAMSSRRCSWEEAARSLFGKGICRTAQIILE